MANYFPLIVNTSTSRIAELPAGDNLDLSSSNISNVGNITVATNVSTATITATGNISAGNVSTSGITATGNTNLTNLSTTRYQETVVNGGTVSGTLSINVNTGSVFRYTLGGNITINTLANSVAGTGVTLILTQDSTGSRTLTSSFKFLGGVNTLSTAPNSTDILSVFYDGLTFYASLGKGYV